MHKKRLSLYVIICVLLLHCPVYANTTEDLYKTYHIDYVSSLSSNVTDVLNDAEQMKIEAIKYNNILTLQKPQSNTAKARKKMQLLEKSLKESGYDNYDMIIRKEAEYLQAKEDYQEELRNHRDYEYKTPSVNSVSLDAYQEALTELDVYNHSKELGALSSNNVPVARYTDVQHSPSFTRYTLYEPTVVYAMYNAEVTSISNNTIEMAMPDNISLRIRGVTQPIVQVGDRVGQHQVIGSARGNEVLVGFNINGKLVNIQRVLKGKE